MKELLLLCCLLMLCSLRGQAEGIHAVIVSGGMNKLMNHERYWNDCAFLYRTLRQDYHIPKSNITLLMSDGGDPRDDQLKDNNDGFGSSATDLDGDGERDVFLEASMKNLESVVTTLSHQLTQDDHLFLFIIDHGGSDDKQSDSYLWLWNSEKLYDARLATMLNQVNVASMNIVVGQCYSGGFIDDLSGLGHIVTTACRGDELSWTCPDKSYDEFIYHWTCAIAGHDEEGKAVTADTNGDGRVSMAEAFSYARDHDRREETPQYCSLPSDLGERWTFSGVLPTGIEAVQSSQSTVHSHVYDLLGRPVYRQTRYTVHPALLLRLSKNCKQ